MSSIIETCVTRGRQTFRSRKSMSLDWRVAQLQSLAQLMSEHESDLLQALHLDLGRSDFESQTGELFTCTKAIQEALSCVQTWARPHKVSLPLQVFPASGTVIPEPLGLVLIISPWNFPISLTLEPLIGALVAGNCVILKPSEVSHHTSALLATLVPEYLDRDAVQVVQGGVAETTELLSYKFDHVFYTGSTDVGRVVYRAAANHLTPVTLELGGKSPVVVDASANLRLAARRILWGKSMNCGQICIAPDYCLVMADVAEAFYEVLATVYAEFFPSPEGLAEPDAGYARMVNTRHTERVLALLDVQGKEAQLRGDILMGGQHDVSKRFIAPTIFKNTQAQAKVMQEEIFGPLLPVLEMPSLEHAVDFINDRPKPLALYMFSTDQKRIDQVIDETSSGGVAINEVILHVGAPNFRFGGVGDSGIGGYHGKFSFDTFSHYKSVMHQSSRDLLDPDFRYPPYTDNKKWWMNKVMI